MSFDTLQIETPRLLLRVPTLTDLDAWAAMMEDPDAARFIGGAMPRAMSWRGLMTMIGAWHAHGFGMFSVYEKETGRWVGRLGPWQPEGGPAPKSAGPSSATAGDAATPPKGRHRRGELGDRASRDGPTSSTASTRPTRPRRPWRSGSARGTLAPACCRRPTRTGRSTLGPVERRVARASHGAVRAVPRNAKRPPGDPAAACVRFPIRCYFLRRL